MPTPPRRRWYQFSLRRVFLAAAGVSVTFGFFTWVVRNQVPDHFEGATMSRAVFICCCGLGTSAGVLFERTWVGFWVTVALLALHVREIL
jgi:hypothetical protein